MKVQSGRGEQRAGNSQWVLSIEQAPWLTGLACVYPKGES